MKLYRYPSEYPKGYIKKHPIGFLICFFIENVILRHKKETEENFPAPENEK
jgi:hypothetical protein